MCGLCVVWMIELLPTHAIHLTIARCGRAAFCVLHQQDLREGARQDLINIDEDLSSTKNNYNWTSILPLLTTHTTPPAAQNASLALEETIDVGEGIDRCLCRHSFM